MIVTYTLKSGVGTGARKPSARGWLNRYLEQHGRSLAAEVVKAGVAQGYKTGTVLAARQRSPHIASTRSGFGGPVWWQLR
jgi:hypothetical protein